MMYASRPRKYVSPSRGAFKDLGHDIYTPLTRIPNV